MVLRVFFPTADRPDVPFCKFLSGYAHQRGGVEITTRTAKLLSDGPSARYRHCRSTLGLKHDLDFYIDFTIKQVFVPHSLRGSSRYYGSYQHFEVCRLITR